MAWTETYAGDIVLEQEQSFYHFSDTKIKSFAPKKTCFFYKSEKKLAFENNETKYPLGYAYKITLPKGTTVSVFGQQYLCIDDNTEIRIKLTEGMILDYCGRRYKEKGKIFGKYKF